MMWRAIGLLLIVALSVGCSDRNSGEDRSEHVWQEQTDALRKAEDVDQLVQDAAKRQREVIDGSTE
jgi:hypothetical protein